MDSVHAALASDAWTDLVSNISNLTPTITSDDPRPWLGWGEARPDQLGVFLHEATHHWCFSSPVATTIATITWRARVALANALLADSEPPDWILHDLIKVETATTLLRPIAEGLALFAEFDACSKHESKAASGVLLSLTEFFVKPEKMAGLYRDLPADLSIAAGIQTAIHALRLDPSTSARKAQLLSMAFALRKGSRGAGYLAGYLAVKSLWRTAIRADFRIANETDLFLMFLQSYLYDDWTFVDLLLSPAVSEIKAGESVVNHVSARLNDFDQVTARDIAEYENWVADAERPPDAHMPGIRVSHDEAASGRSRTAEAIGAITAQPPPGGSASALQEYGARALERRHFMNLCASDVTIEQGPESVMAIQYAGERLMELEAADIVLDSTLRPGAARLEVIFRVRTGRFDRAAVISRDDEIIACYPMNRHSQPDLVRGAILRTFQGRSQALAVENQAKTAVQQYVGASWYQIAMDHARDQLAQIMDAFYRDLALKFARDYQAIDHAAELMAVQGFRPILGHTSFVAGLSLLGLATSVNPSQEAIGKLFGSRHFDLKALLDALERAWDLHGYPPSILRGEGTLYTTV